MIMMSDNIILDV